MSYAELHAKSNFSFLEGASHPEELVERAAELHYTALAVTDRNSLAGVVRAHVAAKQRGLKLVIGAEITAEDAACWGGTSRPAKSLSGSVGRDIPPQHRVVLWPTDRAAYARLARLITCGRRRAEKGACRLTLDDIAAHSDGLIAGVRWEEREKGREGDPFSSSPFLRTYHEIFPGRCYLLVELHHRGNDQERLDRLAALAHRAGVPLVAAGDVHFHVPQRQPLSDVLCAVRHRCTVAAAGELLFPNAQRYLRSPQEMAALFARYPEALARTLEIARQATFSLDELRYEYPEELAPAGQTPLEYLTRLAWEGARNRYPEGVPDKVRGLIKHELQLIGELHYEAYFLTVWDLVVFARSRGILCQGRGSAANSAVCFCLGVTSVDPERMDLLFERFVSRERNEAPDIDVDFEHERREEVLQYLYQKYGRERAGMTAEVITYRPRSAVRDVGGALGMPAEQIDRLAKRLEHREDLSTALTLTLSRRERGHSTEPSLALRCHRAGGECPGLAAESLGVGQAGSFPPCAAGIDVESTASRQLIELVGQLVGFPRHLSQHTGGMVMTRGPLCELVPIENAAMPDRTVIQWNKDDLDELGILKVDCLALGMLTAIRKCFTLVEQHHGRELTLANIPEGDEGVYEMIRRADTMGVFQIESRAQMSMLPRLQPKCFYDLVIEVAIVRPGPIQGNMVHPYLRRRNGEEPVEFPNEAIRRVLEKTLGVPLFQEQAMRLAVEAAGFTPGEADQLRRAMGAWRRLGVIDQFHRRLSEGMLARGFTPEWAEAVFHQIRGFGEYGFPESHAASFALLVYVSCWLKHHYMAAFTAALLNSQPLGFYAPAQLVRNAREHGVQVLPVDVNFSQWDCTLELEERRGTCAAGRERNGEGKKETSPTRCAGAPPLPSPPSPLLPRLRLGFRMLWGLPQAHAQRIVERRGERAYRSIDDFAQRSGLSRAAIMRLAKAGVFGSLGTNRRRSLWDALAQDQTPLPLFDAAESTMETMPPEYVRLSSLTGQAGKPDVLPAMTPAEEVLADYRTTGLSLLAHPLQFLRGELEKLRVIPASGLKTWPNGKWVRVAGLVLVRQRPSTAKGITFVTLEDETATANLIIRPEVWKRYRTAALGATILIAAGPLQRGHHVPMVGENIHVLVAKLEDFSIHLDGMQSQSRDFC